jgi:branched-chain amino acid transport system substrate-binding protein
MGESLRRARALVTTVVLGVLVAGAAACGGDDEETGGSSGEGGNGKMTIAFPGTLSGALAQYAKEERQGLEVALEEINAAGGVDGKQVEVTYSDDRGKPENAIVIAQKTCSSDAAVVLGYTLSSTTLAPLPTLERCQIPVVATSTTSPQFTGLSKFFFRTVLSDAYVSSAAARYAVEQLGAQRVAVLYQLDDYGEGGRTEFVEAAEEAGAEVVYDQGYQIGTTSFLSQLTKIRDEDPDVIYLASFYPEAARIAQQAKRLNLDIQLLGLDGVLSPELIKLAGDSAEGMLVMGYFNPSSEGSSKATGFVDAYTEMHGEAPSDWSALQYDAMYAVKHAAEAGGGSDREAILAGLPKVDFEGVTGNVSFDENGDRQGEAVVFVVEGGKFAPADDQLE